MSRTQKSTVSNRLSCLSLSHAVHRTFNLTGIVTTLTALFMGTSALAATPSASTQPGHDKASNDGTPPITKAYLDSVQKRQTELNQKAARLGISKTVYVIGEHMGLYGKAMQQAGWQFAPVSDLAFVPNSAGSLVYVSAGLSAAQIQAMAAKLPQFNGTLIVDSHEHTRHDVIDTRNAASEKTTGTPQRQPSKNTKFMAEPADNTNTDTNTNTAIPETPQNETQAAQLYRALTKGQATAVPASTALMTSGTMGTILGLHVDKSGAINGSAFEQYQDVLPTGYAVHAVQVSLGQQNKPSLAIRRQASVGSAPAGAFDRVIDIIGSSGRWNFVGQAYALATRETAPSFANARKFLEVYVFTGDNQNSCYVSGRRCGIYPNNIDDVVYSDWDPNVVQRQGAEIGIFNAPHIFRAHVDVVPAKQVLAVAPSATSFTVSDADYVDSWEENYTYGASLRASTPLTSFSPNVGANLSYSVNVTKKTFAWVGHEERNCNFASTAARPSACAGAGIESVNKLVRRAFRSYQVHSATNSNEPVGLNVISKFLNGGYSRLIYDHEQKLPGDGTPRSRIAREGWTPNLATRVEVPTDVFSKDNATFHASVSVSPRLALRRYKFYYVRQEHGICDTRNFGYHARYVEGYNPNYPGLCDSDETFSPEQNNATEYGFAIASGFTLQSNAFRQ